jgi:hypothetical protein
VLGGRDVTQTRTLYTTLDADKKAEIVLHGLSETDIRAIMLKVGNSDNLTSEYTAKLLKVSEGNPLYLKMISDSIEREKDRRVIWTIYLRVWIICMTESMRDF